MKVAVALLLALGLVACGSSATDSTAPSTGPSVEPSAAPSAATSASAPVPTAPGATPSRPPNAALAIDTIAVVVTNDLRVRSEPRVSDDSDLLEPLLNSGRQVFVVDGPVHASGYDWYQVEPIVVLNGGIDRVEAPFGWVAAAGKDGEPWLAVGTEPCPTAPTRAGDLVAMPGLIGLACFGDDELSIAARIAQPEATCGVDPGWTIEPGWLASTCPQPAFIVFDPGTTDGSLYSVIEPGVDVGDLHPGVEEPDWLDVRITGHYDHAAARTCYATQTEPDVDVPFVPEEVVVGCRATFVITAIARR